MANKGGSSHMNALAAPVFVSIDRKKQTYLAKPNPGRHSLERSITLMLALKKLNVAQTSREASKIIREGAIKVNKKQIREPRFPVGINDIIEPQGGRAHRITINGYAKIAFEEEKQHETQLFKVVGKYKAAKGQIMVRLHDGSAAKAGNDVKVNDSVMVGKGGIQKVIPLSVGAECYVIDGVHVGNGGKIKEIKKGSMKTEPAVKIHPKAGGEFETIIKNIMITG